MHVRKLVKGRDSGCLEPYRSAPDAGHVDERILVSPFGMAHFGELAEATVGSGFGGSRVHPGVVGHQSLDWLRNLRQYGRNCADPAIRAGPNPAIGGSAWAATGRASVLRRRNRAERRALASPPRASLASTGPYTHWH